MKRILVLLLLVILPAGAEPSVAKMVQIANEQWNFFGNQTIEDGKIVKAGHKETDEGYWQRVGLYWKEGVNLNWTGTDTDEAWSAAFMSWVMRTAGMGDRFLYDEWHAHYIRRAIQARRDNDTHYGFWGYRLAERAPQVGDLVCYARQDDVDFDHQPETYKSHSDLVVAVRPHQIEVIGGNVEDSVSKKILATDDRGHLTDQHHKWFAVLQNRLGIVSWRTDSLGRME